MSTVTLDPRSPSAASSHERVVTKPSGFLGIAVILALIALGIETIRRGQPAPPWILLGVFIIFTALVLACGLFVVAPNESRVLVLFGKYTGTVKANGFFWVNPFTLKHRVSLRARNLNGQKIKVNDRAGNPLEIAAVVVWQVRDTYAAKFDVDDYQAYVETQSESAVRKLASSFDYDGEEHEVTLRGSTDEVSHQLQAELQERLERAGVHVIEARISHLAYAPEIAQAMLQRQQAHAVVAARTKIVEGAVGMVEMALERLSVQKMIELDEERRAHMVSNRMVGLCGDRTTPVVNVGTMYS